MKIVVYDNNGQVKATVETDSYILLYDKDGRIKGINDISFGLIAPLLLQAMANRK